MSAYLWMSRAGIPRVLGSFRALFRCDAARGEVTVRPMLKPALRRLWRDDTTLQLGVDPARAVVLTGVGPTEARLLAALNGTLDRAGVFRAAEELGVPPAATHRLLDVLGS